MLRNGQTHFKILRCHPGIVGHFQNHAWKNLITMTNKSAILRFGSSCTTVAIFSWPKETSKNPVQLRMGQGIQEWTK